MPQLPLAAKDVIDRVFARHATLLDVPHQSPRIGGKASERPRPTVRRTGPLNPPVDVSQFVAGHDCRTLPA
jgi:hypothetical protein